MTRPIQPEATLPTPMENLVPLPLRRAYMTDNVVNAVFQRAARTNVTREQALIDAVQCLFQERQRLISERARMLAERPPGPIVVDGIRFVPKQPLDPSLSTAESGAPGHTFCDYEDCDETPPVTLPRGAVMCAHHAAVALLAGMSADEAKSTFRFARPVPEDPWPEVPADAGTRVLEAEPADDAPEEALELIMVDDPTPGQARDWFFTFGSGHSWGGESLGRYYVKIHGTAREARRQMMAQFGQKWSHQYATPKAAGIERFALTELRGWE